MSKLVVERIGAGLLLAAAGLLLGGPGLSGQAAREMANPHRGEAVRRLGQAIPVKQAAPRCAQGGVRIDRPRSGSSSAGKPPPRLQGGRPASEAAEDAADPLQIEAPGIESTGRAVPPERTTPSSTVRRPPVVEVDEELALAQREYDAAFSHYTTLVTTGGEGDVEQARERYRQSYERLKALKRERGIE